MSKQLYEEVLADVNKVKEIAEDNAKRAVIEAVVPRIRDLIERELLGESLDDDCEDEEDVLTDDIAVLDLNAVAKDPAGTPVDGPQFGSQVPVAETTQAHEVVAESTTQMDLEAALVELASSTERFKRASKVIKESTGFNDHITQMISRIEDTYEYVQGSVVDPIQKGAYETKLESLFQDLNTLQESASMSKQNKHLNEEDVTLKLTGLPDEIDLDSIGVDLITGDEEGEEGDELAMDDAGDDVDATVDGDDQGDVDFDAMGGDDQDVQFEADEMSDDTVVEIDENMLRTEIAKLRKIRESEMKASVLDDFGGGHDEGDQFLDGEVTTEVADPDQDQSQDDVYDYSDGWDRSGGGVDECSIPMEALQKKLALETRLILRARARRDRIKEAMATARSRKNLKLESTLRKDLDRVNARINETHARITSVKGQIEKSKALNESRSNRGSQPAENTATERKLRQQLAEANLFNVKLMYSNKLLQNEGLSQKQKAQAITQLDGAKTEREAKLVYESLTKAMAKKADNRVNEGRQVLGSSSRPTRPASTQVVSEGAGFDLDRWSKLAGIK
jgi:hypothetical protein